MPTPQFVPPIRYSLIDAVIDGRLQPLDLVIYEYLLAHDDTWVIRRADLCEKFGISEKTYHRAMHRLHCLGLVMKGKGHRDRSRSKPPRLRRLGQYEKDQPDLVPSSGVTSDTQSEAARPSTVTSDTVLKPLTSTSVTSDTQSEPHQVSRSTVTSDTTTHQTNTLRDLKGTSVTSDTQYVSRLEAGPVPSSSGSPSLSSSSPGPSSSEAVETSTLSSSGSSSSWAEGVSPPGNPSYICTDAQETDEFWCRNCQANVTIPRGTTRYESHFKECWA